MTSRFNSCLYSMKPPAIRKMTSSEYAAAVFALICFIPIKRLSVRFFTDSAIIIQQTGAFIYPSAEESRCLAEGRQLVLSSFPSDIPEFPVNWTNCHIMNDRNAALCARAVAACHQT